MSEATVTPLPSKPVEAPSPPGGHRCPDCGRTFRSGAGLGGHRSVHSDKAAKTTPPPMAERTAPKAAPVAKATEVRAPAARHVEHQAVADRDLLNVLAVAYHQLNGADVGCAIDSAATLIDALAANGWMVVET